MKKLIHLLLFVLLLQSIVVAQTKANEPRSVGRQIEKLKKYLSDPGLLSTYDDQISISGDYQAFLSSPFYVRSSSCFFYERWLRDQNNAYGRWKAWINQFKGYEYWKRSGNAAMIQRTIKLGHQFRQL